MKNPINWKDHVVENPERYKVTDLGNGLQKMEKSPGEIVQQGTPMNAKNFNDMDLAAIEAILMSSENSRLIRHLLLKTEALEGEQLQITLNNAQKYPFNNSKKTVPLSQNKNKKTYSVMVEVLSKTGGSIGDIEVTDKLLNGFKIAYTGSASQVVVNCIVQGGV